MLLLRAGGCLERACLAAGGLRVVRAAEERESTGATVVGSRPRGSERCGAVRVRERLTGHGGRCCGVVLRRQAAERGGGVGVEAGGGPLVFGWVPGGGEGAAVVRERLAHLPTRVSGVASRALVRTARREQARALHGRAHLRGDRTGDREVLVAARILQRRERCAVSAEREMGLCDADPSHRPPPTLRDAALRESERTLARR